MSNVYFILLLSLGLNCWVEYICTYYTMLCTLQCLYFIGHANNSHIYICLLGEVFLECSTQCVFVEDVGVKCSTICAHVHTS